MNSSSRLTFVNLVFLWFGAAISVAEILTGGLLAGLGLSKGMVAVVAGHLIGTVLLVMAGAFGYREKLPSLRSFRLSFGKRGSHLISIINVLQLIGWTAVMVHEGGAALSGIAESMWGQGMPVVTTVIVGLFVCVWVMIGIKGFKFLNMAAVALLFVLTVVVSVVVFGSPQNAAPVAEGTPMSFSLGLELSIIMPLSWFPLIADYTCHATSKRAAWLAPFIGYGIGSTWMYAIGLVGALHTGSAEPSAMMLAAGLGTAAMLVVGLSTITTTFLDAWSAAISAENIFPGISRRKTAAAVAIVGTVMAATLSMTQYVSFLLLLGSVFAPLIAIVLSDAYLFKADNRNKGLDVGAACSLVIGIGLYHLIHMWEVPLGATLCTILATLGVHGAIRAMTSKKDMRVAEQEG